MEKQRIAGEIAGIGFEVVMLSARGGRVENQDNLLVQIPGWRWSMRDQRLHRTPVADWPESRIRIAVLDGMGGYEGGREAAERAATCLADLPPFTARGGTRGALHGLHDRLLSTAPAGRSGSTLTVVDLDIAAGSGLVAHIGDSRGYRRFDERWYRLTHDHRVIEFAYRDGELDRRSYENALSMPTNEIAQALGFGSVLAFDRTRACLDRGLRIDLAEDLAPSLAAHADIAEIDLCRHGDQILLATDGILGLGAEGRDPMLALLDVLGPLDPMLWLSMVDLAAGTGGDADNTTGVLLRLR